MTITKKIAYKYNYWTLDSRERERESAKERDREREPCFRSGTKELFEFPGRTIEDADFG